jgi:hypothetical protein
LFRGVALGMLGTTHGNDSMSEDLAGQEPGSVRPRLSFSPISAIDRQPAGERWLVEGFLTAGSLTVLAASPKVGKTFVCLALAIAVATGTQAMGRYQAIAPGRVMMFPAEDDPRSIRSRMEALLVGQGLQFTEDLAVDVITAESLKLDSAEDRVGLEELLRLRQPRLLILDPLVRLHSGAESSSSHMSELFGYLRQLCRRYELAIVVTHHLAKSRTSGASQPGHAMRGSGDVHAAYDHGAMLTRQEDGSVLLSLEHRSAASPDPVAYRLRAEPGGATRFEFFEPEPELEDQVPAAKPVAAEAAREPGRDLERQVLDLIAGAGRSISQVAMRKALGVRNAKLTELLHSLEGRGVLKSLGRMGGWVLRAGDEADVSCRGCDVPASGGGARLDGEAASSGSDLV